MSLGRLLLITVLALFALGSVAVAAEIIDPAGDAGSKIDGTSGDDTIFGLGGNDVIRGLAGSDTISGGPGADDMSGGAGRDAATYADATAGIVVVVDDLANDGVPGEQDNVQTDIEDLFGSPLDDTLVGSAGSNLIDGGTGTDLIDGDSGRDQLFGGPGDDRINARDGEVDQVDCGEGALDIAVVDNDDVVVNCDVVDRGEAPKVANGIVRHNWAAFTRYTQVRFLQGVDLSPDVTSVEVRCAGKGCPFKKKTKQVGGSKVSFTREFGKAKLKVGAKVEVRIIGKGATGRGARFKMRRAALPSVQRFCLAKNSLKARACE